MQIDPSAISTLQTLVVGFVFAGLLSSTFELLTERRASFTLLESGGLLTVVSIPLLIFSAPFIILRNTLRGRRYENRPIGFVMLATIIAGLWSLCSGAVLRDAVALMTGA